MRLAPLWKLMEISTVVLIDSFAVEIGELKQEMAVPLDGDPPTVALRGPEEEVSGVYLQPPPTGGAPGTRDSGYSSLRRRMSVLDRLVQTHPIWLQLSLSHEEAASILTLQPPGTFLVRKSSRLQKKVISLRLDDPGSPVRDFPVKESQYTFSLEGSGISFADLFRLVAFYCISRDVLPFPLRLPEAIAAARTHAELEEVAQQGAAFWDSARGGRRRDSERQPELRQNRGSRAASLPVLRTRAPSQVECSQPNGALCFINPLFQRAPRPDQETAAPEPDPRAHRGRAAWVNSEPLPSPPRPPPPRPQPRVPDQRSVMPVTAPWAGRSSPIPVPSRTPPAIEEEEEESEREEAVDRALSRLRRPGSSDGPGLSDVSVSTSSSDSLDLFTPGVFLAGGSPPARGGGGAAGNSSSEEDEEEETGRPSARSASEGEVRPWMPERRTRSFVLLRMRRMSGVFTSFMTPEKKTLWRIVGLSQDKASYFGCLVQDYLSFLQENRSSHTSGEDLLQTLRQFMTQMKAYLCQSSELDPPMESLIPESQIDQVLEKAMHKCVLKPLKGVVDAALRNFQVSSGAWQQLRENLALAKAKRPQELGVDGAVPPDPEAIERIRLKLHNMCKMYSPDKKVSVLLRVCKLIYNIMEKNSGRMYGADDFLPMLTYVLAQCDMPQLDAEIQYMMELLDPSLLQGEGGYYLTSAYGAMSLIRNFQEEQAARVLSSETRNTLHQWHRRRTTEHVRPCIEDFQNYLRVALQEAGSGCTAKTLAVGPLFTAEEVCQLCARKFKVPDPEDHALFLLVGDSSQQLAPDTRPQKIKAELHSRPHSQRFHFVYRRVSEPLPPGETRPPS
ncbi:ras and Rab interactor 2 isoform X3 [Anguilla anguilla]|uniref:ras and Rab interactor 2 isoform X3 n=1 Tax=Anguilla anguilla TaxID=7936 RepID=UPI0015A88270|nr:ras and Rab interactor 2 isoform X3 [Anguilla anguilla]